MRVRPSTPTSKASSRVMRLESQLVCLTSETDSISVRGTQGACSPTAGRRHDKPETEVQLLPRARRTARHCRPAAGRLPGTQETWVRFPPMALRIRCGEVEDRTGLITHVRQARLLPPLPRLGTPTGRETGLRIQQVRVRIPPQAPRTCSSMVEQPAHNRMDRDRSPAGPRSMDAPW